MKKIINPGKVLIGSGRHPIFCKIEITDGKLSISGVEGPNHNGNCAGSCGQIGMGYAHRNPKDNDDRYSHPTKINKFDPLWSKDLWFNFLDIWDKWHLNDMKANCEHQTGPEWDTLRKITIYHFRLNDAAEEAVRAAKRRAQACVASGKTFTPSAEETRLACLNGDITYDKPELPKHLARDYQPNGPRYKGDHYNKVSEVKTAGCVLPEEHALGLLCKPCPVCGYKYGREWRKKELPAEVVKFLQSLPESQVIPAWV